MIRAAGKPTLDPTIRRKATREPALGRRRDRSSIRKAIRGHRQAERAGHPRTLTNPVMRCELAPDVRPTSPRSGSLADEEAIQSFGRACGACMMRVARALQGTRVAAECKLPALPVGAAKPLRIALAARDAALILAFEIRTTSTRRDQREDRWVLTHSLRRRPGTDNQQRERPRRFGERRQNGGALRQAARPALP